MKYSLSILFIVSSVLQGCSTAGSGRSEQDQPMELGWVQRSALLTPQYQPFVSRFDTVKTASEFIGLLRAVQPGTEVLVFFGTWCGDSKREVPHFLKIADEAGIDSARIKLYGLDRSKKSQDGVSAGYGIERVPTFIFLRDGKEVGRITEKPQGSLESDMLTILAQPPAR